jgi:hypothetical protein
MQKIVVSFLLVCLSSLAAAKSADLLVYKVYEKGVEPYISRILITDELIRLDEGAEQGNFTLYNRVEKTVYSIDSAGKTILVLKPMATEVPSNNALILTEEKQRDLDAPKIGDITPLRVELLANSERCTSMTVAPGLMSNAMTALRELKATLALIEADVVAQEGSLFSNACEMASNLYGATRTAEHGLPLSETSGQRQQVLLDFSEQHDFAGALFELPKDYRIANPKPLLQ